MNLLLTAQGYPPAIIRTKDRLAYINSLEKAQLGGSKEEYFELIAQAVDRSLDIYLKTVHGEDVEQNYDKLLKIGEIAKAAKTLGPGEHIVSIGKKSIKNARKISV